MLDTITFYLCFSLFLFLISSQTQLGPCDPIDPVKCYLPYPNNFWLRYDTTTNTTHLNFTTEFFPLDRGGDVIDPIFGGYNALDGYPFHMAIMTYFANLSTTNSNLPTYYHMKDSENVNVSGSVLLDTVTGLTLPHFTELDYSAEEFQKGLPQLLMLWPSTTLLASHRYIVAFRKLITTDNKTISPSPAFEALRDNITTTDPNIELRRNLFNDIFARLETIGWERSSVLLAWDFNTSTLQEQTGRVLHMRDDSFQRLNNTIKYRINSVSENISTYIARQVEVTMTMPQYVDRMYPGAHLVIDPKTNLPQYTGQDTDANITILIPQSLLQRDSTGKVIGSKMGTIVQYGHGLFGSRDEVLTTYLQQQSTEYGYVLIATDWIGMTQNDLPAVVDVALTNWTNFKIVPERTSQGILRALTAMRLVMQDYFQKDDAMTFNGFRILDQTSSRYYYGNSNGGILGSVYMGVSTDVTRGCLGVGGGGYTLLLPRSHDFQPFYDIIKAKYPDSIDRIWIASFLQTIWGRTDPTGYMGHITSDPLPNTPQKQVLLQHGLGDAQVSYVGVYVLARSVNSKMFESNVNEPNEELYGFTFISDNTTESQALVSTWKFTGVPPAPETNTPPDSDTDTHEGPRRQVTAQSMMNQFFVTGDIVNTCGGPCTGTM